MAGEPLLKTVFGEDLTAASARCPSWGLRWRCWPACYLSVQYLLALGTAGFIWVLAVAALAEVGLLAWVGADLTGVAIALCGLQAVCADDHPHAGLPHREGDVARRGVPNRSESRRRTA